MVREIAHEGPTLHYWRTSSQAGVWVASFELGLVQREVAP